MLDPAQILKKANQRYSTFLCSVIAGESFFPLEFPVGSRPKDYLGLLEAVTRLIEKSKQSLGYGYTLELESQKTQKYGLQSLPKRISIDSEQDYLKLIQKKKEVAQFKADIDLIRGRVPDLESWLYHHPLQVVKYGDRWSELLSVCEYFQQYPKPNLYIRELPIPVHTKFVEQNKKSLRSLLEAILPSEQLVSVEGEKEHIFEKRFALKYREPLIRLRFLDQALTAQYGFPATDISIPLSDFTTLNLTPHRCVMTENLMNFLTLPPLDNSFALFGSGYGIQVLKAVNWLSHCPIFYWGDLDLDGFKILSQLRSHFPQTISIMMDRITFETFQEFAVVIPTARVEDLQYLTPEEQDLYRYLALHSKRLEQERIKQDYANQILGNYLTISSGLEAPD